MEIIFVVKISLSPKNNLEKKFNNLIRVDREDIFFNRYGIYDLDH